MAIGNADMRADRGRVVEIRSHLGNRIARIFFCFVREKMILLHGFIKKSRVAPATDLTLARDRKADLERRLRTSHLRQQT